MLGREKGKFKTEEKLVLVWSGEPESETSDDGGNVEGQRGVRHDFGFTRSKIPILQDKGYRAR
jgi:hypothetical protein